MREKRWTEADLIAMPRAQFALLQTMLEAKSWTLLGLTDVVAWRLFTDPVTRDVVLQYRCRGDLDDEAH